MEAGAAELWSVLRCCCVVVAVAVVVVVVGWLRSASGKAG